MKLIIIKYCGIFQENFNKFDYVTLLLVMVSFVIIYVYIYRWVQITPGVTL